MSLQNTITGVINQYGEDITFTTGQTEVYDEDNGWSYTGGSDTTVKCVPYEFFSSRWRLANIGNQNVGDLRIVTIYSIALDEKDKFTYRGKNYQVTSINPLPFEGVVLAQVVIANEILEGESQL